MNKLKQNAFWAAMGGVGIVLLILFAVLVVPLWGEQSKYQRQIKGIVREIQESKVPGDPDMEKWRIYRTEAIKAYEGVTKYYGDSSRYLQRWFPGLGEDPARDSFMSKYSDEINALEAALQAKGTKIGIGEEEKKFGFNWERPKGEDFDKVGPLDEQKRVLRELQKRFWARQRVANAVLNGNVRLSRVHDFRFFKHLHEKLTQPPWEAFPTGADAVLYPAVGMESASQAARTFAEYDLPNELGKTLTFGFALELPYSEVPKVISEILNPGMEKSSSERLLVNVVGCHVSIREQNEPEKKYKYYRDDPAEKKKKEEEARQDVRALDVMMLVTCQIVDFDASKVKQIK